MAIFNVIKFIILPVELGWFIYPMYSLHPTVPFPRKKTLRPRKWISEVPLRCRDSVPHFPMGGWEGIWGLQGSVNRTLAANNI